MSRSPGPGPKSSPRPHRRRGRRSPSGSRETSPLRRDQPQEGRGVRHGFHGKGGCRRPPLSAAAKRESPSSAPAGGGAETEVFPARQKTTGVSAPPSVIRRADWTGESRRPSPSSVDPAGTRRVRTFSKSSTGNPVYAGGFTRTWKRSKRGGRYGVKRQRGRPQPSVARAVIERLHHPLQERNHSRTVRPGRGASGFPRACFLPGRKAPGRQRMETGGPRSRRRSP